ALAAPTWAEQSVESLARYLIRPARTDAEKIRSIFRWVTANVAYDTRSYFSGTVHSAEAEDVLDSRTAVCGGFAGLVERLGIEAGLDVQTVSGYVKGFGYRIGKHFDGPATHAWNAVRLENGWNLLDATWGAGYMNEEGRFVREFDEHFFLTPPERMIYTHFPEDSKWQLLSEPVPLAVFENRAYIKPAFFKYNLGLKSHVDGLIDIQGAAAVVLDSPSSVRLSAQVLRGKQPLGESLTFVQRGEDSQTVLAAFPSSGTYTLRIFAKFQNDQGPYEWILEYSVRALVRPGTPVGFPEVYLSFEEGGCFLERPLEGRLKAGRTFVFSIRIPEAQKAFVITGNKWIELPGEGDRYEGKVKVVKGSVQIAALFPGESNYSVLLKYAGY
ncbi:MAG TPA: transglutaminase domain-containing protein, partial [bacterium]